jgi:hypothetical protein
MPSIQIEDISNYVTDNKTTAKSAKEMFNLKDVNLISKDELTKEDRQQSHSKWKRNVRTKLREKQRNHKLKEISKTVDSKFEAKMKMKQIKDKNIKKNVKNSELKSSKFFSNLQSISADDQMKKSKKKMRTENQPESNTDNLNAKKFKL